VKTLVFLDSVDLLIDEVRRSRHILGELTHPKENISMDLLTTTQNVVRSLKNCTYEQKIEVLELARKQFDLSEKAAQATAAAPSTASTTTTNAEGQAVQ